MFTVLYTDVYVVKPLEYKLCMHSFCGGGPPSQKRNNDDEKDIDYLFWSFLTSRDSQRNIGLDSKMEGQFPCLYLASLMRNFYEK